MGNEHSTPSFNLNFSLPFKDAIRNLCSIKNRKMLTNSHNYHVLYALFAGETIDDYDNKPVDDNGKVIHNIKARVSDLVNHYGIEVERKRVEDGNYVEYWIDRGNAS